MKWLLSLLCFTTIAGFSQIDKPLLKKLRNTQERLSGIHHDTIPYLAPGLQKSPIIRSQENSRVITVIPKTENYGPGTIPNAIQPFQFQPPVVNANQESIVMAMPQDKMPCIVPNMQLFKTMPNAGSKSMLESSKDPGIYLQKPKS